MMPVTTVDRLTITFSYGGKKQIMCWDFPDDDDTTLQNFARHCAHR